MQNAKLKTIINVFFALVIITASVYAQKTKEAEFAGSFYPVDKNVLSSMIDGFLNQAGSLAVDGDILGIVVPHAGYIYSGAVAAYSYKSLTGKKFDTVVLLGSSHRHQFRGIAVYDDGVFSVPLGELAVDKAVAKEIGSLAPAQRNKDYFNNEHSLEVQLPFIIKTLGSVQIVPVLFGEVTFDNLEEISRKLTLISQDKKVLILVSTDLSHYLSYSDAVEKDEETAAWIKNKNVSLLWDSWINGEGRGCGISPLTAFLMYVKEKNADIEVLKYANSGDTAQDKSRVVGYMSAVAFKVRNEKEAGMQGYSLTDEEKNRLLKIARMTLERFLKDGKKTEVKADSDNLKVKRGAFVTLHKNGQLRGCIGTMAADAPLYKVIAEFAVYSATQDRRFSAVTYDELKDIEIEISVLTEPQYLAADSWQDLMNKLQPLRDGVIIISRLGSSTYLPQVWEQLPDKEEFLSSLCVKGGLAPDYWKTNFKDIKVQTYQAIVFSESQF